MSESRRLPARVYWVRRFVVLGIPLIVIAGRRVAVRGTRLGGRPGRPGQHLVRARRARADARPATDTGGVTDCDADDAGARDDGGRHLVRAGRERHVHRLDHQHRRASRAWWTPARRSARSSSRPAPTGSGPTATASCPAPRPAPLLLRGRRERHDPVRVEPRSAPREGCPPDLPVPGRRDLLRPAHPRRRERTAGGVRAGLTGRVRAAVRRTARGCWTPRAATVPRARPGRAARRRRRRP